MRRARRVAMLAVLLGACTETVPYVAPTTTSAPQVTTTAPALTTTAAPAPSTTTLRTAGIQQRAVAAPGALILMRFDEGMAQDVLGTIEETLPLAREEFGDSGSLVVHVYADADTFVHSHDARSQQRAREDVDGGLTASASTGAIWVYGPRFVERDRTTRRLIVLHEYFHTVQLFLTAGRSSRAPLWLREGTARYFEVRAGADRGFGDFNRRRDADIRQSRPFASLQTFETSGGPSFRGGSGEVYPLGFLASDYLVKLAGVDALKREVWVQLRTAPDWQTAFAAAFGVSSDQFYADFEAYRQTL